MIAGTYLLSGGLLMISAWLFRADKLNATTQTFVWVVIFFASAGASSGLSDSQRDLADRDPGRGDRCLLRDRPDLRGSRPGVLRRPDRRRIRPIDLCGGM